MRTDPTIYFVPVSGRFEYKALKRLKELLPGEPASRMVERGLELLLKEAESKNISLDGFDAHHNFREYRIIQHREDWWRH
jgi:hypothetical protein